MKNPAATDGAVGRGKEQYPEDHFNGTAPPGASPTPLPTIARSRLRLLAERVHRLGPRPLFELLRELDHGADLHDALERYGRLYPLADFIAALDGDQLPPPARLVRAGRR